MYNKKYRLVEIKSTKSNPFHSSILNKVCYPAYLNIGERGWFLCDTEDYCDPVHRLHTTLIKDVKYTHDNKIIVTTENTEYVFEGITNETPESGNYKDIASPSFNISLPCKVGSPVYFTTASDKIYKRTVRDFRYDFVNNKILSVGIGFIDENQEEFVRYIDYEKFGKTFFFNETDAEASLSHKK